MNHKKGDWVTIKSDLESGKDYGALTFTNLMKPLLGKRVRIKAVYEDCYGITSYPFGITDEMIEVQ